MRIEEKENELNIYLSEWADAHMIDWKDVYDGIYSERHTEIYQIEGGHSLLDYFYSIKCNLENLLCVGPTGHVIPTCKSSIDGLMISMRALLNYINEGFAKVEKHLKGDDTKYYIYNIYQLVIDAKEMIERCIKIYSYEYELPEPYIDIRDALRLDRIDLFLEKVSSIIAGLSYGIYKEKYNEGHFHTILHIMLKIIGFSPVAEDMTNTGRIDMTIKLCDVLYLFEFKYSPDGKDLSEQALKQIKDNKYADKYKIEASRIIGVGVSFSGIARNIEGYIREDLYKRRLPQTATKKVKNETTYG